MRPVVTCLVVLTLVQLRCAWARVTYDGALGSALPVRRAFAAERAGDGLVCLDRPARRRMTTERRLLVGAALDAEHLTPRDWEALPQVGPARARALSAAVGLERTSAGRRSAIGRVRGLGSALAHDIVRRLGLDEEVPLDICSLGSWPTTSSGYDRQP